MVPNSNWTFDEAYAEHSQWLIANPDKKSHPAAPLYQWFALQKLNQLEACFADGDEFALMDAIHECAKHDLVLPEWAARAYLKGYYAVVNARSKSWDEVFGSPYPPRVKLHNARTNRVNGAIIYDLVNQILMDEPKTPIDRGLFERVGKMVNVSDSQAEKLYYKEKKNWSFPILRKGEKP